MDKFIYYLFINIIKSNVKANNIKIIWNLIIIMLSKLFMIKFNKYKNIRRKLLCKG